MPEQLKDAQNTPAFDAYLKTFLRRKEQDHRKRVLQEVAASLSLMIAG